VRINVSGEQLRSDGKVKRAIFFCVPANICEFQTVLLLLTLEIG